MTVRLSRKSRSRFDRARLVGITDAVEVAWRRFLCDVSPTLLVQYLSLKFRGRLFNPQQPRSFDDKLLWLMLYWREPLKSRCADKYAVRSYLADHDLGHLLPQLLGVYAASADIDFSHLPERFVLKCTHGCNYNIICSDRNKLDIDEARRTLDTWMKIDFRKLHGELHYASIKPRIICEAFLDDRSSGSINDYKVHCFGGRPHCTMVCTERNTGETKYDFYDLDWKNRLAHCKSNLPTDPSIPKPQAYRDMLEAAEKLSKPFPFVRVDFYSVNGKPVFSEMTFTPHGGIDTDLTDLAEDTMGDLLVLPEKLLG